MEESFILRHVCCKQQAGPEQVDEFAYLPNDVVSGRVVPFGVGVPRYCKPSWVYTGA